MSELASPEGSDRQWSGRNDRPETYFTDLAGGYARHRPTYPAAAISAALEGLDPPVRAVDVGCGTGIATRLLAAAGARAIGVDPNEAMLAQARAAPAPAGATPPTFRAGSAERTGLPDASADLVVCAQAFHWFEPLPTLVEFARVLRADGRLALLWNTRETGSPVGAGYQAVMASAQRAAVADGRTVARSRDADPTAGGLFGDRRELRFDHPIDYDRDGLIGRARSCSYFPAAGPLRDELEAALHALFDEHARDGRLAVPHFCRVVLATRAGQSRRGIVSGDRA